MEPSSIYNCAFGITVAKISRGRNALRCKNVTEKERLLHFKRSGRTLKYVESRTGLSAKTITDIERKTGIKLRRPSDVNWSTQDEFNHRCGFDSSYMLASSVWVSNSPELKYSHGVA